MNAPIRYPEPEDFVSAFAKPFDSEVGRRVVEPFGIAWSDAVKLDRNLEIYNVGSQSLGIDFTFKDEAMVNEEEGRVAGNGPFLLTNCGFWGYEDSYTSYAGGLWKGLQFSDTPADVEGKLGKPTRIGRYDIHHWELPEFRLTIHWKSPGKIRVVSYWMKSE